MLSWQDFFDAIYLINLDKRIDRYAKSVEQFDDYDINFARVRAIDDSEGARGLRDTMLLIFDEALRRNYLNILVFEDDFDFLVGKEIFDDVMNKAIEQLPSNYHMLFLGCQLVEPPKYFHSPNLLVGQKMFATHSVGYSIQGIKEVMARDFKYPIDNFYVDAIQPMNLSFCTYPILCSQKEGYSDIAQHSISWKPFIEYRFEQRVNEMRNK